MPKIKINHIFLPTRKQLVDDSLYQSQNRPQTVDKSPLTKNRES